MCGMDPEFAKRNAASSKALRGWRQCQHPECNTSGYTSFCKLHRAGRPCQFAGCHVSAPGCSSFCDAHRPATRSHATSSRCVTSAGIGGGEQVEGGLWNALGSADFFILLGLGRFAASRECHQRCDATSVACRMLEVTGGARCSCGWPCVEGNQGPGCP